MKGPKSISQVSLWLVFVLLVIGDVTGQQNPFEIKKRFKPDTLVVLDSIEESLLSDTFRIDNIVTPDTAVAFDTVETAVDSLTESFDTIIQEPDTVPSEETEHMPTITEPDTQTDERRFRLDLLDRIRDWQESNRGTIATKQGFLFAIVIIFLMYLVILLGMNRSLPRKAIRAITNDNYLRFMQRDFSGYPTIYWLYYLLFFMNAGFFIFLLIQHFAWVNSITMLLLVLSVIIVAGMYFMKHLVLFLLGLIFPVEMETGLFSFVIMLLNIILGFILLPLNIVIAFAPTPFITLSIWTGCLGFVLLYLFRQMKGIFISSRFISEFRFHFFLYLCAVEIAPILIIYKIVSGQLGIQ
jgi:hypothetical protein